MWKIVMLSLIGFLIVSCNSQIKSKKKEKSFEITKQLEVPQVKHSNLTDSIRFVFKSIGLVSIQDVDDRIIIDLRYASENNFMHKVLYDTIDEAFLQNEVAIRLSKVQDYLDSIRPGYRLKIFDAIRPNQVQGEMWEAMDSVPTVRRGKYVSNPLYGSVHNFGAAVDLTIADSSGVELDMGAGYDDFRDIAFPSKESQFLKSGELSINQVDNRKLLRKVMATQGFNVIPSEWWHFNAFSRITAESKFEMLVTESGAHRKSSNALKRSLKSDSLSKPE